MRKPRLRKVKSPAGWAAGQRQSRNGNAGIPFQCAELLLPWPSSNCLCVYTEHMFFDRFHCLPNRELFLFLWLYQLQFSWASIPTSIDFETRRTLGISLVPIRAGPRALMTVLCHRGSRRSRASWSWVFSTLASWKANGHSPGTCWRQEGACFQSLSFEAPLQGQP